MPDNEQTNLTPATDGTGNQTPQEGTSGSASQDAPVSPPAQQPDYETKFKASQSEAMRLYQENQRLQSILNNSMAQHRQEPAANPAANQDDIYSKLTDAVLDRDVGAIKTWESRLADSVERKITSRQQQQAVVGNRISASMSSLNDVFKDQNSPLAYEAIKRYGEILNDPTYSFVQPDTVNIPTPTGPIPVNPHLMRIAVTEARANIGSRVSKAESEARTGSSFIEPAGGSAQKKESGTKFDPQKHMSETERHYCDVSHKEYAEWWKYADQRLKDARLKAGKALDRRDIR